ncbi:hypothetical protein ACQPZA_33450 [Pseudonocardia xinjiangensis]|uniref:hypothetical protein n=1 Tax=Pseudonocardia xinjiangensis TaxID=75289 RepID=UPI003D909F97
MPNSSNQKVPRDSDSAAWVPSSDARVVDVFDTVKKCIVIFGVISAVVLATVATIALAGGFVNTFMWVRAGVLLLTAVLFYQWAVRGSRGAPKSVERLRIVSTILPIAVVVVDLIPGVCPVWYVGMQAVSAVPLVAIAVLIRRRVVKAAFPGKHEARGAV